MVVFYGKVYQRVIPIAHQGIFIMSMAISGTNLIRGTYHIYVWPIVQPYVRGYHTEIWPEI